VSRGIRPVALGIIWRGREILVFEAIDVVKGERFHRPLGGGIEFGERAQEAVVRELFEETGFRTVVRRSLGVLESVFEYEGRDHHEVCFVFEVAFDDAEVYERQAFDVVDVVKGEEIHLPAIWVDPNVLQAPLYPDGLVDLLSRVGAA
jgi:8-oxo-dGTP pyrophosphatase MutT (NUDIX family)